MNVSLDRLSRAVGVFRAMLLFRGCERGSRVSARGRVHVVRDGHIRIGDRVQFVNGMIATELRCAHGAELSIGPRTVFNYGASVSANRRIRIGAGCLIASMVHIRDDDGERAAPVTIGDDVWIAHGASIEPGVTIGDGSVVSAGSVVVGDVPPKSMAMGNPAVTMSLAMLSRSR